MRKDMLLAGLFMILISQPAILKAQNPEDKTPLAILPFVLSKGALMGNPADVTTIQETVTKEFSDKSRFTVLDRSRFEKIVEELKIQSSEEFLNSKIVEQGKQLGAKYLVAGVVNEYRATRSEKANIFKPGQKMLTYPCSLKMSFAVIDVETGQLLFNSPINVASNDIYSGDSLNSMKKALSNMQSEVNKQIKNILAGSLKILGIDKTGKDGMPVTVMINGGGSVITSGEKVKLGVYIVENVGGYKREKQIAELKTSKVENEVVVCEVGKNGAKDLDAAIKGKTPLTVKIIAKEKSLFSF